MQFVPGSGDDRWDPETALTRVYVMNTYDAVSADVERIALVALTRGNRSEQSRMTLVQQLIEETPASQILGGTPAAKAQFNRARHDVERWTAAGIRVVAWFDDDYPRSLREVYDLPPVIYTRGELVPDDRAIHVLGSQNIYEETSRTDYLAASLVREAGWTVVSGASTGFDRDIHADARIRKVRDVEVVGSDDRFSSFLADHKPRPVMEGQRPIPVVKNPGLLFSPVVPDTRVSGREHAMCDAAITGYASAVLIASGITDTRVRDRAQHAVEQGRPLVVLEWVYDYAPWVRPLVHGYGVDADVVPDIEQAVSIAIEMARPYVLDDASPSDLIAWARRRRYTWPSR